MSIYYAYFRKNNIKTPQLKHFSYFIGKSLSIFDKYLINSILNTRKYNFNFVDSEVSENLAYNDMYTNFYVKL